MSILSHEIAAQPSDSFWPTFVELLLGRVDRAQFETWLARLSCLGYGDDYLDLVAPNHFTQDWIRNHYTEQLREVANKVDGKKRQVRIRERASLEPGQFEKLETLGNTAGSMPPKVIPIHDPPLTERPAPERSGSAPTGSAARHGPPPAAAVNATSVEFFERHSDFVLNEQFTFQQFVTGSCNELACASAKAVAEFPGGPYNPLFIHGSSGLGKTHLLQGVCHQVLGSDTPRRILYLSCENFVNQFITAVTNGDLEAFRYRYRKVDMLLIDDVQFLEGKTRTQEEFFHTFNTLYNAKRQIVLSSDRPPSAIETLQDRLVSRFRWGMVTKIETPCLETRVAILKRKAWRWGVELAPNVAQCLGERIDTNIRELEGAITKVIGYSRLVGRPLDLDTVNEALQDLLPGRPQVTVQTVIEQVAAEFGVQPKELQSKRRVKSVVLPRQVGMYLARQFTRMSLEEIGGFFGGRDHSTVLHSIKKIEGLIGGDPELALRIQRVAAQLAG